LVPVLRDIPAHRNTEIKEFSRTDIDKLRADGRKTRLGIALISSLVGITAGPLLITSNLAIAGIALLIAVPIIWILLYVMKVGPDSWHAPSLRQLERMRKREIEAQRKDKWSQLSDEARGLAQRQLSRWNEKQLWHNSAYDFSTTSNPCPSRQTAQCRLRHPRRGVSGGGAHGNGRQPDLAPRYRQPSTLWL